MNAGLDVALTALTVGAAGFYLLHKFLVAPIIRKDAPDVPVAKLTDRIRRKRRTKRDGQSCCGT